MTKVELKKKIVVETESECVNSTEDFSLSAHSLSSFHPGNVILPLVSC